MRIATRSQYGMGDCMPIPGATGQCRDNSTGGVVPCSSSVCAAPSPYVASVDPLSGGGSQTAITTVPGFGPDMTISVPVLEARLREDLHLRTVWGVRPDSATPDQIYQILLETAQNYCYLYPGSCPSASQIQTLVGQLTEEYRNWYNARLTEYYTVVDGGSSEPVPNMPAPPTGYVAPSVYVSGPNYETQQNALNRIAPTSTGVTPSGTQNVLQTQAPTGGSPQVGSPYGATGTDALTTRPGEESQQMAISGWLEQNWVLLAAGAAALVLLPNLMGGRR